MHRTTRIRTAVVTALALAICGALGAQAASAATVCTPSVFHPMKTTYTGLHATAKGMRPFGTPSLPVFNPNKTPLTTPVSLTSTQTTEMTVSASVTVGASGLVASVEAQTGISVSRSASISSSVTIPVRIPGRQYGWVQSMVGKATVQGTVTQVDMICNKQFYRGPITVTAPFTRPVLVPMTGLQPPR